MSFVSGSGKLRQNLLRLRKNEKQYLKGTQLISYFKGHIFDGIISTFWWLKGCTLSMPGTFSSQSLTFFHMRLCHFHHLKPCVMYLDLLSRWLSLNANKESWVSRKKASNFYNQCLRDSWAYIYIYIPHPIINICMQQLFTKYLMIMWQTVCYLTFSQQEAI